jgi:signal transduction histidine kinase
VITLLDPTWRLLAIQDQTGAVLVQWPPGSSLLRLGQEIAVTGATSVDNHVPFIVTASVRGAGDLPLPTPEPATIDALACGEVLYRRVEVALRPDEGGFGDGSHTARYTAPTRCGRLTVIGRLFRQVLPGSVVGRRIKVRGVPIASYSPSGSIDRVTLMFDSEIDVDILEAPIGAPGTAAPDAATLPAMRSLREVKTLPRHEASRGYPAEVEGVVTSPNPRHTGYFMQDGAVALYVAAGPGGGALPRPGQRVRVRGRTERGGFAPIIRQTTVEILGDGPMPTPAPVTPGDVFRGWEENRWVEMSGLATAAMSDTGIPQLEIFAGPRRLLVWFASTGPPGLVESFVDARVVVGGVYSPLFSASGALRGFRLYTPSPAMVRVVSPPPAEPEFRTIGSLSQFDVRGTPEHRIRTAGVVTYRDSKGQVYLQDDDSTLRVAGTGAGDPPLDVHATVDGFLSPESGAPRIEHVRWVATTPGTPITPVTASAESLAAGEFEGRLVTVEGFLESRRTSGGALLLSLLAGRTRFSASLEAPDSVDRFPELRPGALLRLTGVHAAGTADAGEAGVSATTVGLRRANDIVVARPAPWWDLRRALLAALAASLLLVLVLAWVVRLRQNLVAQMALRTKLEERLLHAQKIESVGRLAGGVAHDFNNYLTVMLGHTSLLLDTFRDDPTTTQQLEAIRDVGERAASLTQQLLAFSRKQMLKPVPCDLNEAIARAKTTLLPLIGEHIHIVIRPGQVDRVSIDPNQFLQVLMNLAVNARDAMPQGGTLTFETSQRTLGSDEVPPGEPLRPGRYVCVSVSDTGTGMGPDTRQRIFEPFFTTKERGRGTGLGLAVVFGIVKQSNGIIEVSSTPGVGTTFQIYLPAAAGA